MKFKNSLQTLYLFQEATPLLTPSSRTQLKNHGCALNHNHGDTDSSYCIEENAVCVGSILTQWHRYDGGCRHCSWEFVGHRAFVRNWFVSTSKPAAMGWPVGRDEFSVKIRSILPVCIWDVHPGTGIWREWRLLWLHGGQAYTRDSRKLYFSQHELYSSQLHHLQTQSCFVCNKQMS